MSAALSPRVVALGGPARVSAIGRRGQRALELRFRAIRLGADARISPCPWERWSLGRAALHADARAEVFEALAAREAAEARAALAALREVRRETMREVG